MKNKNSSFLNISANPIYRAMFAGYQYLTAMTDPVGWIMDRRVKTVLDVGCGQGYPMQLLKKVRDLRATGVDLFDKYLSEAKRLGIYEKLVKQDVKKLNFKPKSYDAVVSFQVIEHMKSTDGLKLLKAMERIARYQVIVATPLGYCDHPETDDNHLQKHLSGWVDQDFIKLGYTVKHQGLKLFFANEGLVHRPIPGVLKAIIFVLDRMMMPIYFFFPQTSDYWIIAYKRVG